MKELIRDYQMLEEIYLGAFDDLYLAEKNGIKYVLKVYKDPTGHSSDFDAFVKNQEMMLPMLQSLGDMAENIVEQFVHEGRFYQVKDYIEGQNLRDWMDANDDYDKRLDIAIQLCECMKAVHSVGIVRQEIKPEDVMVVKNLSRKSGVRLVLIDFDWAVPNGKIVRRVGTPGYSNVDSDLTYKSDIFSLGIVLCELLTGCNPYAYDDSRVYDVLEWQTWVKEKDYTAPININDELPSEINDIIEQCLDPGPDKRPTTDEILAVLKKNE